MRVFSVFHKTDQNRPKIYKTHKTNKIRCAIQRNTVLCVFLSLRKCLCLLQKTFAKHVQNIAKHSQDTAKHRKTLFFEKHLQNTAKHPQNTCKTPQNIAKHHKTDLLTKQTELANNPLRSRKSLPCGKAVVVGLQAGALGRPHSEERHAELPEERRAAGGRFGPRAAGAGRGAAGRARRLGTAR